jgi:hypothetical protein
MGKYEPLAQYLTGLEKESWDARFEDVERILGFELPESAYHYPAWWANQDGHHSQTKGWRDAGWETSKVDLAGRRVRFIRRRSSPGNISRGKASDNSVHREAIAKLLEQASALSGITDHDELLRAALSQFIRREAGKRLIASGGSMPDAWAPERRQYS